MARKYFTTEQIVSKLREASQAMEISEQSYYRWRKEYGGVSTEQVHRLKETVKGNF